MDERMGGGGRRRQRGKMRHSNQPVRTKGGGRGWTREAAPRQKVARSRGSAARGNTTISRHTRGKRKERRQWTRGNGASRGRGCTSRGGVGASRGGGAARGNTTTSRANGSFPMSYANCSVDLQKIKQDNEPDHTASGTVQSGLLLSLYW